MTTYAYGDEITLKVEDVFGYSTKTYRSLKVMVIGIDDHPEAYQSQFLCYVPPFARIPVGFHTFRIDHKHARFYDLHDKFIGELGCFITALTPTYKHEPAPLGERCDRCDEFFAGAQRSPVVVNDDDGQQSGGDFRCRACRENPWR